MQAQINKRGGHRGCATKLCDHITNELNLELPSREKLEGYIAELENQKSLIKALDETIALGTSEEEIEQEINEASDRHMKIFLTIRKANKFLSNIMEDRQEVTNQQRTVRLPQLSLLRFSGEPLEWLNFWELFRSSVHERSDLPPAVKFQYLAGQLDGEASRLLSGFNHSASEYAEAVDLLVKTYGQKKTLIQARLNAIMDMKSPESTAQSLRDYRSSFEGHIRVLKSLGANIEDAGYVFAHLLIRKLPNTTRDNISRATKTDIWSLEELREAINEELNHLSAMEDKDEGSKSVYSNFNVPHSASFPVSTKSNSNLRFCRFCRGEHFSHECKKYTTVKARRDKVIEIKACFNCLKTNHSVSTCLNKGTCRLCGKRHHTTLCTKDTKKINDPKRPKGTDNTVKDDSNSSAMTITSTITNTNKQNFTSLLPTANVTISCINGHKICKALLDAGSQKTFLLKSLATSLQLETVDSIHLNRNI